MKSAIASAMLVVSLLVSGMSYAEEWPSYEDTNWADARAVSACGNSFVFGMDEGLGTMTLSQIRKITELEEFRRTWRLKIEDTILCEMAYRLLPEYFEPSYWKFMRERYPNGWPGYDIPLRKKSK